MYSYRSFLYFFMIFIILIIIGGFLRYLEKICNKNKNLYEIIDDSSESSNDSVIIDIYENCSICLEPLIKNVVVTNCNHKYHKKCLKRLKKSNLIECPICRTVITTTKTTGSILK